MVGGKELLQFRKSTPFKISRISHWPAKRWSPESAIGNKKIIRGIRFSLVNLGRWGSWMLFAGRNETLRCMNMAHQTPNHPDVNLVVLRYFLFLLQTIWSIFTETHRKATELLQKVRRKRIVTIQRLSGKKLQRTRNPKFLILFPNRNKSYVSTQNIWE